MTPLVDLIAKSLAGPGGDELVQTPFAATMGLTSAAKVERWVLSRPRALGLIADLKAALGDGFVDVLAERVRQVEAEGYDAGHDDAYHGGELEAAASGYAFAAGRDWSDGAERIEKPSWFPWSLTFWKPESPRRALVKAGALILAAIARLDRAAKRAGDDVHG